MSELSYQTFGPNPNKVFAAVLPIAALTPHLHGVGLGRFYNTLAPAIMAETYTVQLQDGTATGFAAWGKFNQVVAARFRCSPDGLTVSDCKSGEQQVLIALASPFSPELQRQLKGYLSDQYPLMPLGDN